MTQCLLAATRLRTEILAEKRHDVVLETVGHLAGMSARVDLEAVYESIFIESVVQFASIHA